MRGTNVKCIGGLICALTAGIIASIFLPDVLLVIILASVLFIIGLIMLKK